MEVKDRGYGAAGDNLNYKLGQMVSNDEEISWA